MAHRGTLDRIPACAAEGLSAKMPGRLPTLPSTMRESEYQNNVCVAVVRPATVEVGAI